MNFLIFRDFFGILMIFINLFEFIWIYLELKRIKNHVDVATNVVGRHHVASYECTCACACARAYVDETRL